MFRLNWFWTWTSEGEALPSNPTGNPNKQFLGEIQSLGGGFILDSSMGGT